MKNSRREFIKKAGITGAAVLSVPTAFSETYGKENFKLSTPAEPFKLKYAPYFGMFEEHCGKDLVDNIKFCYDMGFRAMFDNGLIDRPVSDQEKISREMNKLGMELGPFVLYADFSKTSFVLNDQSVRDMLAKKMKDGLEISKRTGAKWALMVPGRYDEKLHRDYQTANIIDNLRFCCDIIEKSGLTIVIEPLNTLNDHPGLVLTGIPQAYAICRGVNRPQCKIVNDLYHQQITEGNLIPNIEAAWSEIGAFHLGDNPGRNEPTSGEINFKNIFKYIYNKKYQGVLCMEHGKSVKSKEGEAKLIQAYRECDNF
ncbi:MAG: TIM barrel protein [Bacteroidales bacterium]